MSNPYDQIAMKARPIKVDEIIANPKFFEGHVICFEISDQHMAIARKFAMIHKKAIETVLLTMKPYTNTWSMQAQRFLFTVRDRLCGMDNDFSPENKEQVYAACMIEAGFINEDGTRKSLHDLDRREMWILIETMMKLAVEAGCEISDLEENKNDVQRGVEDGTA